MDKDHVCLPPFPTESTHIQLSSQLVRLSHVESIVKTDPSPLGVLGTLIIARCFEFTVVEEGRKLTSEIAPGVPKDIAERENKRRETFSEALLRGVHDAWHMAISIRGIGYDFGSASGLQLPKSTLVFRDRASWISSIVTRLVFKALAVDILCGFLRTFPGVGTLQGGTIFLSHLPVISRYFFSSAAHTAIGLTIVLNISFSYDILILLGTCVFHIPPTDFPALFGKPWSATSVHQFWAVEWHQVSLTLRFHQIANDKVASVVSTADVAILSGISVTSYFWPDRTGFRDFYC